MGNEEFSYNTSEFRNPYSQHKYRDSSSSMYKDEKECDHILSLNIAKNIQSHTNGPISKDLKPFLNSDENFYMINKSTNLKKNYFDDKIFQKYESGEKLNKGETYHVQKMVNVLQSNQENCPQGFYNSALKFTKGLNSYNGKTLWDKRKDK